MEYLDLFTDYVGLLGFDTSISCNSSIIESNIENLKNGKDDCKVYANDEGILVFKDSYAKDLISIHFEYAKYPLKNIESDSFIVKEHIKSNLLFIPYKNVEVFENKEISIFNEKLYEVEKQNRELSISIDNYKALSKDISNMVKPQPRNKKIDVGGMVVGGAIGGTAGAILGGSVNKDTPDKTLPNDYPELNKADFTTIENITLIKFWIKDKVYSISLKELEDTIYFTIKKSLKNENSKPDYVLPLDNNDKIDELTRKFIEEINEEGQRQVSQNNNQTLPFSSETGNNIGSKDEKVNHNTDSSIPSLEGADLKAKKHKKKILAIIITILVILFIFFGIPKIKNIITVYTLDDSQTVNKILEVAKKHGLEDVNMEYTGPDFDFGLKRYNLESSNFDTLSRYEMYYLEGDISEITKGSGVSLEYYKVDEDLYEVFYYYDGVGIPSVKKNGETMLDEDFADYTAPRDEEVISNSPEVTEDDFDIDNFLPVTDNDTLVDCWLVAQNEVKNQLKYPHTAKFPFSSNSSDVTILESYNSNPKCYAVVSWVEGENDFGTSIRYDFSVLLYEEYGDLKVYSSYIDE